MNKQMREVLIAYFAEYMSGDRSPREYAQDNNLSYEDGSSLLEVERRVYYDSLPKLD